MDQTVKVNQTKQYRLPTITDAEGDSVKMTVFLGFAGNFTVFKSYAGNSFTIQPYLYDQVGKYTVYITLTDNNVKPMSRVFTFNIYVYGKPPYTPSPQNQTYYKFPYNVSDNFTAKIESISVVGLVTVKFSDEIFIPNNYTNWTVFNDSILELRTIGSEWQDSKYLNFSWNCTMFDQRRMYLQLNFTTPGKVSFYVTILSIYHL